jgi:cell division protein FtsB
LDETELIQKITALKAQRQEQDDLIAKYKIEIAFLEHQASIIKENAELLEDKCFKRTRLEP